MKSDLLADLRADVEAAARKEQAALEAAKAERLAEEARQRAAEEAARDAAAAARLEAEARRVALLEEARAALRAPAQAPQPQSTAPVAATPAPVVILSEPYAAPPPTRGINPWLAAAGVMMVCATAITVALIWSSKPEPAPRLATPPPPVLQVVDSPEIPGEALVLPTAHVHDTAPVTAAPAEKPRSTVVGKRPRKGPKKPPRRDPKPEKPDQLDLGDFMKAN